MSGSSAPAGDPSMEDILASIRRILNEDEPAAEPTSTNTPAMELPVRAAAPQPPPSDPPAATADSELTLDSSMLLAEAGGGSRLWEQDAPGAKGHAMSSSESVGQAGNLGGGLLGSMAADTTASSLAHLARSVAGERSSAVYAGGPTIEDVVREELRPLLRTWLDTHLPPLVERLVRAEIERVASRATQ